jgi:Fur family ferric uptake transcriptional regulator
MGGKEKEAAVAIVKRTLRERGQRYTSQRAAILEAVLEGNGHFNAEEATLQLRRKGVSRATIYRMLPILVECGILERAFRHDGKQCYERLYGGAHHDHLLCIECGRAIEFRDDRIEKIQDAICRKKAFHPSSHRLVVHGVCSRCAARSGSKTGRR